jgi:DNA-binding transcriptional regulator LsrR (DeoR family)
MKKIERQRKSERETDSAERPAVDVNGSGRTRRLRLRAAWMYFVEERTQAEVAEHLGISRVAVVRLLSDARERHEIKFSIQGGVPECVAIERELERRFGLSEAVVAPLSDAGADPIEPLAAAVGQYISDFVRPGMRLGVGWGRTLLESLRYIREAPVPDLSVVSLLGGITKVRRYNPSEFAWRFSSLLQAQCYLMTAPAIVDSPQTRRALIERCGLGEVFERARSLDAAVLSVGGLSPDNTAYRDGFVSDQLRREMIAAGAVGETMFNFFDASGRLISHPIHNRVMSIPAAELKEVPQRIIAAGGLNKVDAVLGALRLIRPTVLITDEVAASRILELDNKP